MLEFFLAILQAFGLLRNGSVQKTVKSLILSLRPCSDEVLTCSVYRVINCDWFFTFPFSPCAVLFKQREEECKTFAEFTKRPT